MNLSKAERASAASGRERGSVIPLYVMAVPIIMVILSMGIDLATIYAYGIYQDSNIRTAYADVSEMGKTIEIKNSDTPGHCLARSVFASLRSQGFDGDIDVSFYEAPSKDMPTQAKRLIVYEIDTSQEYGLAFGKAIGMESVAVKADSAYAVIPYAPVVTWRPASADNGTYHLTAGKDVSEMTYTASAGLSSFSAEMKEKVDQMLEDLKEGTP